MQEREPPACAVKKHKRFGIVPVRRSHADVRAAPAFKNTGIQKYPGLFFVFCWLICKFAFASGAMPRGGYTTLAIRPAG